ncbi:hypothetical protein D3C85_957140 [compost metagenome]
MLPGPLRRCPFLVGEQALDARLHLPDAVAATGQQADFHVRPGAELLHRDVQHGLAVGGGGELAGKLQQRGGFRLGIAQGIELAALARGQVAGKRGHEQEEHQRQHVLLAGDGQGKGGRDEQEVVGDEGQSGAEQRRPQAAAHRHQQHRSEEHQGDVRQLQGVGHAPGEGAGGDSGQHGQAVVQHARGMAGAGAGRATVGLSVQHADFQALGMAQQALRQAAAEQAAAQALAAAAHQQQAGTAFGGMLDQGLGHGFGA